METSPASLAACTATLACGPLSQAVLQALAIKQLAEAKTVRASPDLGPFAVQAASWEDDVTTIGVSLGQLVMCQVGFARTCCMRLSCAHAARARGALHASAGRCLCPAACMQLTEQHIYPALLWRHACEPWHARRLA